ncbi:MAG: hypothetical protein Q9202_006681 [Teloschistes flavicans]
MPLLRNGFVPSLSNGLCSCYRCSQWSREFSQTQWSMNPGSQYSWQPEYIPGAQDQFHSVGHPNGPYGHVSHGTLQPLAGNENVLNHRGFPPRERFWTSQGSVIQPSTPGFSQGPMNLHWTHNGGQVFEDYQAQRFISQDSLEHPLGPMNTEDQGYASNQCPRPRSQGFLDHSPWGLPSGTGAQVSHQSPHGDSLTRNVADVDNSKSQKNTGSLPSPGDPVNIPGRSMRPLAAKHTGSPSAMEKAVRTRTAVNKGQRSRNHALGLYTITMDPTQKRRRRKFSDAEKAHIRDVRRVGACTECKQKKRQCTHVATPTTTDLLSPPCTASEIGDSVSPDSTQTSNAIHSSPDTILEEIDHDGTDLDLEFDFGSSFQDLFPEGTAYPTLS